MGLRCSLFGHDYGEPFVERDREERGNEVVVTERELTECARCGAEKVTSQNTEVRTLGADAGRSADRSAVEQADASPTAEPDATPGSATDTAADATPDTAESSADARTNATPAADADDSAGGAFTSASDAIEQAETGTSGASGGTAEAPTEPAESGDDAVIMDDEADDGPGSEQWGEHSEPDPEQTPTPEPEPDDQEDVEFIGSSTETTQDAERAAEDATEAAPDEAAGRPGTDAADAAEESTQPATGQPAADAGAEPSSEPETGSPPSQRDAQAGGSAGAQSSPQSVGQGERSRGEWPDHEGEDEGFDATPGSEAEEASFQFGEDAGQEVVEPGAESVDETQFTSVGPVDQSGSDSLDYAIYCPECGFERGAAGSSLRAGDICPECRRGYLAEDR
jgi:hypothetical protein